jgi:hypothetical protein
MNRAPLTAGPGADLQTFLQELVSLGPRLMFDLAPRLMVISADTTRDFVRAAGELISATLPTIQVPRTARPCCEIPETPCPPRCVCDLTSEARPGEAISLTVRVINASKSTRTFQLHATTFVGPGGAPGALTLAPSSLTLEAGHAGIITATFTVPNIPEGDYRAEIVVQGAYEQCVRVTLRVRCRKTCGDEPCICDVVQGEPPVRIRAHDWYDHFQCTEPCDCSPRQHRNHNH